jgi:hypothetical protein
MRNTEHWVREKFPQPKRSVEPGEAAAYLLAGAAIGAALTILLTPRSGPEVRHLIVHGCRRTIESLTGGANQLRKRAHNLGDDLRDRVPTLLRFGRRARTVGESGLNREV